MATSTTEITTEQRLTIVKHLANGRPLDFVATVTDLPVDVIREVGNEHGGVHNPPALTKAAKVLQTNLDREARAGITERPDLAGVPSSKVETRNKNLVSRSSSDRQMTAGAPQMRPAAGQNLSTGGQQVSGNGKSPTFDATAALLLRGRESGKRRTQRLAEKISEELTQLRDALDAEDQERRQAEQLEKEKAEARAEVERLQRELREAQERARRHNKGYTAKRQRANAIRDGQPRTATPKTPSAAALVRQWAAEQGIDCPAFGRIPRAVQDAYDNAHRAEAS